MGGCSVSDVYFDLCTKRRHLWHSADDDIRECGGYYSQSAVRIEDAVNGAGFRSMDDAVYIAWRRIV